MTSDRRCVCLGRYASLVTVNLLTGNKTINGPGQMALIAGR